jgi:hypothetical protein
MDKGLQVVDDDSKAGQADPSLVQKNRKQQPMNGTNPRQTALMGIRIVERLVHETHEKVKMIIGRS